jgi:hypothetical protein
MPKSRRVESNLKISRIEPPAGLISSYRVLGGLDGSLLLSVNDLTENEAKYVLCKILDELKLVNVAITTGNLETLLKSLEGIKKYNVNL